MNSKQMKKWLELQGAINGKQLVLPIHGTEEIGKGLETTIKRQLGLK